MARRWAKEPIVGEGPPNDARVDPAPSLPTPAPASQTLASIKPSKSPSSTAKSSIVTVTSASKSSIIESSTSDVSTSKTTMIVSTSLLSSSIEATATPETLATTDISSKTKPSALPKGAIIGIAIGGAAALFLIVFLASFLLRRRRRQTSRKSAHKPRPSSKNSTTESQISKPQLYTKVSTSSDHDSPTVTCVHSSDVSSLSTTHPEMLYSYSYPDSTDGEMRPYSLAEVDARLSTFSQTPSGVSDQTSFSTPSTRSFESGEGRPLRTEHNDYYGSIEGPVPSGSTSLTPMPIPRKSSKRKSTAWDHWNEGSVGTNSTVESGKWEEANRVILSDAVELGSEIQRRSKAESMISEVDGLIKGWDTISIKTVNGQGAIKNKKDRVGFEETTVERVSRMNSQRTTSSFAPSVVSDEALDFLGVGTRTGSFPRNAC